MKISTGWRCSTSSRQRRRCSLRNRVRSMKWLARNQPLMLRTNPASGCNQKVASSGAKTGRGMPALASAVDTSRKSNNER